MGAIVVRWTGRCLSCGRRITRRWWQRGLLAPLPLCPRGERGLCQARGAERMGLR